MLNKISARLRKREGFTLIELLVVVAIIGLLATLAMPRVFESIKKARKAQGDADVHTVSTAIEQLFMESSPTKYPTDATVNAATVIGDDIRDTGMLKAASRNLVNQFGNGYIYITSVNGLFYAVIDPADTANTGTVTMTCGAGNTVVADVNPAFTVKADVLDTFAPNVTSNKCTAQATGGGPQLTVVTN
ncbi:MAG: gspG [Symbiobacteriaceae bacterium]|jgi:prepilin-type N-terminal cleavage/methylation domain-containing protein|nr:gspG [Symbiobacteriaceae bacterium]